MDATSGSAIPDDCGTDLASDSAIPDDCGIDIASGSAIPDDCGNDKADFAVGKKFNTLDALEEAICRFQDQKFIQLWKRDARTIDSVTATGRVERPLKADLKYYQVKYCCVHGGKTFKPEGHGVRKNTM